MIKTPKEKPAPKKRVDSRKALEILQCIRQSCQTDDRFKGMTEGQIIQAIKKTREEIWQEKLAPHA